MEPDLQITFQDKKPRLAYVAFLFHIVFFFQFTGRYIGLPIGIPAKHIRFLETKEIVVYHCTLQRFNGSWVMKMFWESYRILLWNSFLPSVPRGQCSKTLGPSGAKLVFFFGKKMEMGHPTVGTCWDIHRRKHQKLIQKCHSHLTKII